MFVNLTKIFANGTVAKATFTPSPVIRTAVMSQHHKVLTLTFTKNQTRNSSTFTVEGANAKGNKTTVSNSLKSCKHVCLLVCMPYA